eukprot:m.88151 g.88151  ORF g.88151 m.88151 type:complete len:1021 (-) comp13148_c0_seq1:104-3166(-)
MDFEGAHSTPADRLSRMYKTYHIERIMWWLVFSMASNAQTIPPGLNLSQEITAEEDGWSGSRWQIYSKVNKSAGSIFCRQSKYNMERVTSWLPYPPLHACDGFENEFCECVQSCMYCNVTTLSAAATATTLDNLLIPNPSNQLEIVMLAATKNAINDTTLPISGFALTDSLLKPYNSVRVMEIDGLPITGFSKGGLEAIHKMNWLSFSNTELTEVELGGFAPLHNLTYLGFQLSPIATLYAKSTVSLPLLNSIAVTNTTLTSVDLSAFHGLMSLNTIRLIRNRITTIELSKADTLLASNVMLELDYNYIEDISPALLYASQFTTTFSLAFNKLTIVQAGAFADVNLTGIFIQHNQITRVMRGAFQRLPQLSDVDLSNNLISIIEDGTFSDVPSIMSLILQQCRITLIEPNALSALTSLSFLDISSNNIIQSPSCNGLNQLETLYLSFNNITVITEGAFQNMAGLEDLYLDNCDITFVQPGAFSNLPSLNSISLGYNNITMVANDTLSMLPALATINFADNKITSLAVNAFHNLSALEYLALTNNQLTEVHPDTFKKISSLKQILLGNNLLQSIPMTLISSNLTTITLDNNNISNATQAQVYMNNLLDTDWPCQMTLPFISMSNNSVGCFYTSKEEFNCGCVQGHINSSQGLCVENKTIVTIVVHSKGSKATEITLYVLLGLFWGGLIAYSIHLLLARDRRLRYTLGKHAELLQQRDEELTELIRAWEISQDDVVLMHRIDGDSEGAFGEVWYAQWDGIGVAVKRLRKTLFEMDDFASSEFENEVELIRKCRHRNIVRFFGAGNWDGVPFLVTEYLELGSLSAFLRKSKNTISRSQKISFALDIQAGMHYIHTVGRIHRDLKTGNVLLSKSLRAKVADFGSMKSLLSNESFNMQTVDLNMAKLTSTLTTGVGTPFYMAPEVLRGERYGVGADIWSFGVVLWEIDTQEIPDLANFVLDFDWSGPFLYKMHMALQQGHRLSTKVCTMPAMYQDLMASCMSLAALARPTFVEIGDILSDITVDD